MLKVNNGKQLITHVLTVTQVAKTVKLLVPVDVLNVTLHIPSMLLKSVVLTNVRPVTHTLNVMNVKITHSGMLLEVLPSVLPRKTVLETENGGRPLTILVEHALQTAGNAILMVLTV